MKSKILTIAGSDSCAGAGILADIKTASSLKTYIATAITCLTAQDSGKVYEISYLNPNFIKKQIEVILDDMTINVIKIGMVGNEEIIKIISKTLKNKAKDIPIIIDPIITATSLDPLLKANAIDCLKQNLIANSYLVTPNIDEAELLSGIKINNLADMQLAGKEILKSGVENILIKGGHLNDKNNTKSHHAPATPAHENQRFSQYQTPSKDGICYNKDNKIYHLLISKNGFKKIFSNNKLVVGNIHGTGCTFSTAIASFLSKGYDLSICITKANEFVYNAIKYGDNIGRGNRILNHFFDAKKQVKDSV